MGSLDRINNLAYQAAIDLAASSPRADYTPGQLPVLPAPVVPSDIIVAWRGSAGQTYGMTVAELQALITPVVPTVSFTQNSFRNKIINGNMGIDQRNLGASITPTNAQYSADRYACFLTSAGKFSMQQVGLAPTLGVPSAFALRATALSSFAPAATDTLGYKQVIEAERLQETFWGTSAAVPVTISFWARGSTPGTFPIAINNGAVNRSYVSSFTVSGGTFAYYTITIPGDTAGAWTLTGSGAGLQVVFGLGVGTNFQTTPGTWQTGNFQGPTGLTNLVSVNTAFLDIADLQLEVGSGASAFEQRPIGTELDLCQRYCYALSVGSTAETFSAYGTCQSATQFVLVHTFPTTMRTGPGLTTTAVANFQVIQGASGITATAVALQRATGDNAEVIWNTASGGTNGFAVILSGNGSGPAQIIFNADY